LQRCGRISIAALFVSVAGFQVVRTAIVNDDNHPALAARLWAAHPKVLRAQAMSGVADAGIAVAPPSAATQASLELIAREDPFSADPFLVQAALAVRTQKYKRGEALLLEARRREPRSPATRFLLADLYLRSGRPIEAMGEMAVLNRFLPASAAGLAPALAAYARDPRTVPQIRNILRSYPELEEPLLAQLSTDSRNADAILALASPRRAGAQAPAWQSQLLGQLVNDGQYARAHQLWSQFAGVGNHQTGLFNPTFNASSAPPPFNWALSQGSGGVAEAKAGGLNLLYFGREDLSLAQQVLLLKPGRYTLSMNVSGQFASNLMKWVATCLPSNRVVMALPLTKAGPVSGSFNVDASCAAIRLALTAEGEEFPERSEFRVEQLQLQAAG
jgi:hypothetical protein